MTETRKSRPKRHPWLRLAARWMEQIADPRRAVRGMGGMLRYFVDWRRYRRLPGSEPLALIDATPQLHDRSESTSYDPHYFFANGWAARRILKEKPALHIDVASHHMFVNLLAAAVPVVFVDYRPLRARIDGLQPLGGDLLRLPFRDRSIASLSCLHAAEHVGLGRYGDPLQPDGTRRAARELARVLAPGGSLYFALPVGRPRVCFNAHRIHDPRSAALLFPELTLEEFRAVDDDGTLREPAQPAEFADRDYACGLYRFRRPSKPAARGKPC